MKRPIVVIILALAVWIVWPYYTMHRIGQVVNDGDAAALEGYVSWDSVRQGIKDDVNAVFAQVMAKSSEEVQKNPFAGLAAAFAPVIVNQMVDGYMTPTGLAALMKNRKAYIANVGGGAAPAESSERKKMSAKNLKYAFFTGPTTFLVELGDKEGNDDQPLRMKLAFEGFGWKISRIYLPVDDIAKKIPQGN